MRYGADHKQESHRKVLAAAARVIREHGPAGVSVAAVMAEAGLTHGAFYAHFPSKGALIAAAIETMFEESQARLDQAKAGLAPRAALNAHIDYYLSGSHCDKRDQGCPLAALGSEVPRLEADARAAFAKGMAQRQQHLEELLQGAGVAQPSEAARSLNAELLGALMAARLAAPAERDGILKASKHALKQRFGLEA